MISPRNNTWNVQYSGKTDNLRTIIAENRGIKDVDSFTKISYEKGFHDPLLLPNIEKATTVISEMIDDSKRIVVYGDYDADGITATAILVDFLRFVGAVVDYKLPHREHDGYGLKMPMAERLVDEGYDLVITTDCGISNAESIDFLEKNGVRVVITDHHSIGETIPNATAIVHPKLPDSRYPYQDLCGAGVAYKLVSVLAMKYLSQAEREYWMKWALDLAAIGTVADCSDMTGENRAIVAYGLKVLRKTRRPGLVALYPLAGLSTESTWDTDTIGFRIAPRINAAGRLDDPKIALRLLLTKQQKEATDYAQRLQQLNLTRQERTAECIKEAFQVYQGKEQKCICYTEDSIPAGIIGLVAGKLTEYFSAPSVVVCKQDDIYVGSMRSIPSFNIMEYLPEFASYLEEFGGHAQAAGFSVSPENREPFLREFKAKAEEVLQPEDLVSTLDIECELPFSEANEETFAIIRQFAPFGIHNLRPVFVTKDVEIIDMRFVGNDRKHAKISFRDKNGVIKNSICFNATDLSEFLLPGTSVHVAYEIELNKWNGTRAVELKVVDIMPIN